MRRPFPDGVGYISQVYGANPGLYGYGPAGHMGLDYGGCAGQPVLAMHAGMAYARWSPATYGQWVTLLGQWNGADIETRYAHMVEGSAKSGVLAEGQPLGIVGNSGRSDGAHLHTELWINGLRLDPEPFVEGGRMPSKLTGHFQSLIQPVADIINASPARHVKQIFYGSEPDSFPSKWTIARLWIGGDQAEQALVNLGAAGAEQYFGLLKPRYQWLKGKVWAIEGPNEPYVKDPIPRRNLAAFTVRWAELMKGLGWRVVVGSFANGNPDVTDVAALRELLPLFTIPNAILGLHAYGRPDLKHGMDDKGNLMGPEWQPLRHRLLIEQLKYLGVSPIPQIVISEFGLDGTGTPLGQVGWRKLCANNFDAYLSQLAWADAEFAKDKEVLCVCLWNSGGGKPWNDPQTGYELSTAEWTKIGAYMAGGAVPPEPPPPPAAKGLTPEQTDEVLTALAAVQTQIELYRK